MAIYILRKNSEKLISIGDNGGGFTLYRFEEPNGILNPTPIREPSLEKYLEGGFRISEGKATEGRDDEALRRFFSAMSDAEMPKEVSVKDIHFMQSSIKNETGQYTVLKNAEQLASKQLLAGSLPRMRVWLSSVGKIWTLDHRRLAAFRLAKMEKVPVEWATAKTVNAEFFKMTTRVGGVSIRLKLGGSKNIIID